MKPSSSEYGTTPNPFFINCALIAPQIIFGISAVVGTIGLPSFHPLTFAVVREANATIILLVAAHFVSKWAGREAGLWSGSFKDLKLIFVAGLGVFMSQAFYIIGIKLSSAVAASVWQPSQPILTAAICMMIGWEPFNFHRILGIFVAFLGCAIMVLGGGGTATGESLGGGGEEYDSAFANFMGQVSFFINCCGSSLYVLASKRVIATGRYESVSVTAWSYLCATLMMTAFALIMSTSESLSMFLCSDCEGSVWHVPSSAIPALIWYITMTSSTAYGLITWGNKYATGTLVIGYTVIQPIASAVMIQFLISFGIYKSCSIVQEGRSIMEFGGRALSEFVKPCLDQPDRYTAFGAIGVITGLMVVINTEPKKDAGMKPDEETVNDEEENEGLLELGILDRSLLLEDDDDEDLIMEGQE